MYANVCMFSVSYFKLSGKQIVICIFIVNTNQATILPKPFIRKVFLLYKNILSGQVSSISVSNLLPFRL